MNNGEALRRIVSLAAFCTPTNHWGTRFSLYVENVLG
jgi:hypothetical protein